jgi:hypothetical protein
MSRIGNRYLIMALVLLMGGVVVAFGATRAGSSFVVTQANPPAWAYRLSLSR